jgi:hypothetical protein
MIELPLTVQLLRPTRFYNLLRNKKGHRLATFRSTS